jgi:hypothetical protein
MAGPSCAAARRTVAALGLVGAVAAAGCGARAPGGAVGTAGGTSEAEAASAAAAAADAGAAVAPAIGPAPMPPAGDVAAAVAAIPPPQPRLRVTEPPGGRGGLAGSHVVAARLFAFSDTQLHHVYGKRTFAQSPFADRASVEVAIRPAALDDGSDLILDLFLTERQRIYPDRTAVFLGDAADVSCEQEIDAFLAAVARRGVPHLLAVAANHDGFYVGNYTSQKDLDGLMAATDMPNDWTRACAEPGSTADHRLTKGRAVKRMAAQLTDAPAWATSSGEADGPTQFRDAHLYYVRPLGGGDAGAPPVWGVFLDTADYRGYDLEATRGAGTVGAVSAAQVKFLDHAMFEARAETGTAPLTFVLFGHHPYEELEPHSRARVKRLLELRPEIVGYVAGHTHLSREQSIRLGDGRTLPVIVVGSTTDAPQSGRLIEVHIAADGRRRGLASDRLDVDTPALCGDVAAFDRDGLGYTGYRLRRDDVADLDLGWLDKAMFWVGLDDLEAERAKQVLGALLVENELVRAWAHLYVSSPLTITSGERTLLEGILRQRYAGGATVAAITPWLRGEAPKHAQLSGYDLWDDPAIAPRVGVACHALHRFGPHAAAFRALHARRSESAATEHYFLCHALHAAAAESQAPRRRGSTYVP